MTRLPQSRIDSVAGQAFDWIVVALIVYSIVTLTIETLPGLSDIAVRLLWYSEIVVTAVFTAEYALRLRAARAFRLLRILRLLKIGRYNRAIARFHRAFQIAREEMVLYLFVTVILLYVSATGIYYFENPVQPDAFESIVHSLWWALATLTTVGYGDVYPITLGGRIFTFFVLMVGLGIVAVPAGLVASALSQARREESEARRSDDDS